MNHEILEIMENLKHDPSVISKLNIEQLLQEQNMDIKFFENLLKTNVDIIDDLEFDEETSAKMLEKLASYKYMDYLSDFKIGRYIRWINEKKELAYGGILMDITFKDSGTNLLCKNARNRFFNIKYDNNIFFQKLNDEEQFILNMYEQVEN
jgi:hypothetical protein